MPVHLFTCHAALLSSMSSLGYASKISDSLEMGLEILSKLDEKLPRTFPDQHIELQVKKTKAMLDDISVTNLLTYRMMRDQKKLTAMKFLRSMEPVIQQLNPNLLVSD